jgi:muconolactone delta-isomerase
MAGMEYLIDFTIDVPGDTPAAEVRERAAREGARVAELAEQGHALRVWKPPPRREGEWRALGLYSAAGDDELQAILASLPLWPWMSAEVVALEPHPSDPAHAAPPNPNITGPAMPSPDLRHVYRLQASLGAPLDLGDTPQGRRRIVALTAGTFAGRELAGTLLPDGSADWQILRPDGSSLGDIRYTLRTDGGALLYVQSRGLRHGPPEVLARLARGEDVAPDEYTFRVATHIETSAPELAWLNDGVFVAVGARLPAGIVYDVYLVA